MASDWFSGKPPKWKERALYFLKTYAHTAYPKINEIGYFTVFSFLLHSRKFYSIQLHAKKPLSPAKNPGADLSGVFFELPLLSDNVMPGKKCDFQSLFERPRSNILQTDHKAIQQQTNFSTLSNISNEKLQYYTNCH